MLLPHGLAAQGEGDSARFEAWPEVDLWVRLSPRAQLFFPLALSRAREVDYTEALVGAHYDYRFHRNFSARAGYRYLWAASDRGNEDRYREHRIVGELTPRLYLPWQVILLDRNRVDLRSINGEPSWRYRNRLRLERGVPLGGERALTPYGMVEVGFDSRYDEFNRVRLQVGVEYQFHQRLWLDVAYIRQWDDRSSVPRLNALGVAVNLAWCKWCSVTAPAPTDTEGT